MGQCHICSCPKDEDEESGQINFPFLSNLFSLNNNINNTNTYISPYQSNSTRNYNINLFREET